MILVNTIKTRKDETEYLKDILNKVQTKRAVKIVAVFNGLIVGSTGITLKQESENHIGDFGISIR